MNRISHILVVVDPSTKGRQAAVDKAAYLARCGHATVELLICDIPSASNDQTAPAARREAWELIAGIRDRAIQGRIGDPPQRVGDYVAARVRLRRRVGTRLRGYAGGHDPGLPNERCRSACSGSRSASG